MEESDNNPLRMRKKMMTRKMKNGRQRKNPTTDCAAQPHHLDHHHQQQQRRRRNEVEVKVTWHDIPTIFADDNHKYNENNNYYDEDDNSSDDNDDELDEVSLGSPTTMTSAMTSSTITSLTHHGDWLTLERGVRFSARRSTVMGSFTDDRCNQRPSEASQGDVFRANQNVPCGANHGVSYRVNQGVSCGANQGIISSEAGQGICAVKEDISESTSIEEKMPLTFDPSAEEGSDLGRQVSSPDYVIVIESGRGLQSGAAMIDRRRLPSIGSLPYHRMTNGSPTSSTDFIVTDQQLRSIS